MPRLQKHIWLLLAVYFVASSVHFDRIYLAWSVVTAVGIAGLVTLRLRLHAAAAVFIAVYVTWYETRGRPHCVYNRSRR
jgi:hypothetical protein